MSTTKEARSEDQARVALEEESEEVRKRTPTEKGYLYQLDLKTRNFENQEM